MEQALERIRHLFGTAIEAKMALAETFGPSIAQASEQLVNCLLRDGKILLCGNGGSAANCLQFSAAMLNHFDGERPPLPVIVLTSDIALLTGLASGGHHEFMFARQIQALGQEGDVLLLLTTSGNSNSILQAVSAAHDRGMDVIALNGRDGGVLATHLGPEDIELRVPAEQTALIIEMHLFLLHCFCDLIDQSLFGQMVG